MPSIETLKRVLHTPEGGQTLSVLYGNDPHRIERERRRWAALLEVFGGLFDDDRDVRLYSTPGRTEVGGNHTDHNHGRVLAAAVDLDLIGAACANEGAIIRINSAGYPAVAVDIRQLEASEEERFTTAALIRGICARMAQMGWKIGGFDACFVSDVPKGSGLSSSAAFEVQVVTILSDLYNAGKIDPLQRAIIGQYAENRYFGKPSGLMDQTACAVGGFVAIDFKDPARPVVERVDFDFQASGYEIVTVETGGDHADLSDEYATLAGEMKAVARALGGDVLRDVELAQVLEALPELRKEAGDRAILRALHFFGDDQRVVDQVHALQVGDFQRFLALVNESGRSSWMLLQNNYSNRDPLEQGIPLAQAITTQLLGERGAVRVHGGGFAGTIQAFVPFDLVDDYVRTMESVFGEGTCHPIMVRATGATRVDLIN